jgi:hypothetical protein
MLSGFREVAAFIGRTIAGRALFQGMRFRLLHVYRTKANGRFALP